MIRHLLKYGSLLVLLVMFFAHTAVRNAAAGRVFTDPSELPRLDTAIVLGTSRYARGGGPNLFFEARMDAAADLIQGGHVQTLVVSGDNELPSYDEPAAMEEALVSRGVASDSILRDGGGLRTLDSVLRGRDVFRKDRFVVVSQRFHVERAVYLARANGIDAYGFAAADADGLVHVSVRLREYAARVKALLDVHLFRSH
jgi:SanA protein